MLLPTIAVTIPTRDGIAARAGPKFRRKSGVNAAMWPQNTVSKRLAAVYSPSSHFHESRVIVLPAGRLLLSPGDKSFLGPWKGRRPDVYVDYGDCVNRACAAELDSPLTYCDCRYASLRASMGLRWPISSS